MASTTKQVTTALSKAKEQWQASDTPVSLLDDAKRHQMLGAVPSPDAMALMAAAAQVTAPAFAPAVDWRNHNGNHITPVKDQGGCGSCVSFGSCGLIEAMAHVEQGRILHLSEADSHFCSNHGANCGGWWPDQCLDQAIARGICDDVAFPYASAFPGNNIWASPPTCHVVPNRNQRAVKITSRVALPNPTAVKNYLTSTGPVTGCFTVYDDFFHYAGGVYHHVTGAAVGGHCVLVIGYSEAEQCWICKNSWGTSWGTGGFFKIGYADMLFNGQFFAMYGAQGVVIPATGFQSLGGAITTPPVAGVNKDGRMDVFARGTDGALWHIWQTAANNGWSNWASLGGVIPGRPCVISNADGRMEVFARGTDNALWHIWQLAPNGNWSGWASLGGVLTNEPSAGRNKDGRLEVFVRGTDGALWHKWQVAPGGAWSGWASLGVRFSGQLAVGNNADGRLEVFMRGVNNSLVHIWQLVPSGGWSGWASLGGIITSDPVVASNADGRLEVFARGTDNALWHIWQALPNGIWLGWASLGGVITSDPEVHRNKDGRLEAFARGADNALWHVWQSSPGGTWSGWASLGGQILGGAAVQNNLDGRLEAFVRGQNMALWHTWQTAPNNGWN